MRGILVGSIVAGIAVFAWGFLFWGVSPLPYSSLSRSTDDAGAGQALIAHLPQTGTYLIPGRHNPPEVQRSLFEAGPFAMVFFSREGRPMMSWLQMTQGLLHSIGVAFIIALGLHSLGAAAAGYGARVRLVVFFGFASAIMMPVANIVWWYFPAGWQLWNVLYQAVAWLIMGIILARFVRSRPG